MMEKNDFKISNKNSDTTTTEYYYYCWRISKLELKLLNLNHFQSYGLVPSFVVDDGGGGNWWSVPQ